MSWSNVLLILLVCSKSVYGFSAAAATWSALEAKLPSLAPPSQPAVYDTTTLGETPPTTTTQLTIHIDRNHWCPNCERVLFALELKNVAYTKILVHDEYSNPKALPKLSWPDGTVQQGMEDIYQMLEKIQAEYPNNGPDLYKQDISVSVDIVRASIERRFHGIMPRFTEPSTVAPYIFCNEESRQRDGHAIVPKFKFDVCLEEIDEVLEEYDDGPFFAGSDITAADVFWAPYVQRMAAQLPLLYEGLEPRSSKFAAIQEWLDALDEQFPCYSCKIKARAETWQHVLRTFHPELQLLPDMTVPNLPTKSSFDANQIWTKYAQDKPYLEPTPILQVAAQIIRQRESLALAAAAACKSIADTATADAALYELCSMLLDFCDDTDQEAAASKLSGNARDVASFLTSPEGLAVPRDVGVIPMQALCGLVASAPAPRIA